MTRSRPRSILLASAVPALLISLNGCGFIEGLSAPEGDSIIYIGTVRDVQHISGERHRGNSCMDLTNVFIPFYVIDLPISFALDTAALPFTVLCQLFWRASPKPGDEVPVEKEKFPEVKK